MVKKMNILRPDQIKEGLDKYVIGQDEAKITLSVAAYNHYKRIADDESGLSDVELEKSNVILLGETGCGKTYLVQTLAKLLDVPFHIQDCTKLTASGYVGSDVEECLVGLLRSCDYDVSRAEYGIVMLDEGDKIAKKDENPSITRDVSGECVQQSLLKIVEGDIVGVQAQGGRKHPYAECIRINTKNILFILSGAFVGIDKIVSGRIGKGAQRIGFTGQTEETQPKGSLYRRVDPHDLMSFGLIPELVGRFPVITYVEPLDMKALEKILTEPKNALVRQYTALLGKDGVKLDFDRKALHAIAERASQSGTGARALRGIMERVMRDIMFTAPLMASVGKKKVRITEKVVDLALQTA
jgi:endopeptidase Clp ATP-binding regulatory subunit (clpX)